MMSTSPTQQTPTITTTQRRQQGKQLLLSAVKDDISLAGKDQGNEASHITPTLQFTTVEVMLIATTATATTQSTVYDGNYDGNNKDNTLGSGCSTMVEHRPHDPEIVGLNLRWLLGFFLQTK